MPEQCFCSPVTKRYALLPARMKRRSFSDLNGNCTHRNRIEDCSMTNADSDMENSFCFLFLFLGFMSAFQTPAILYLQDSVK